MANKKQMIWEVKKFEDIIFNKREGSETYHAELYDDNRRLLSIIYGEHALYGANHGLRRIGASMSPEIEEDKGYEIMDNIGDNIDLEYDGGDNVYVVSKEELMEKVLDAAKYEYRWEDYQEDEFHKGTKIYKVEREVNGKS